jgi:hypothetical protein
MSFELSRFIDSTAAISFEKLAREWPNWNERERRDFCMACRWLAGQTDFPNMLRFMMQHGGPEDWSTIASCVAKQLPQEESFDLLTRALRSMELDQACNVVQAISLTGHPAAESVLRAHIATLWAHPLLWENDEFLNWLAYGASCCIQHLVEMGAQAEDFTEQVRALAQHPCAGNRDSCRRFLPKHYSWLPHLDGPAF